MGLHSSGLGRLDESGDRLAQAGYSSGDLLVEPTNSNGSTGTLAISSANTWTGDNRFHLDMLVWDDAFPGTSQGAAGLIVGVSRGSGETVDVRLRNATDSDTVFSQTGITSTGDVQVGRSTYTPSTTGSVVRLRAEVRSDGTNSSLTTVMTDYGPQL